MFKKLIFVALVLASSSAAFGAVVTPTTVPTAVSTPTGGVSYDTGTSLGFLGATVSQLQTFVRNLGGDKRMAAAYGCVSFTANAPTLLSNYGISNPITTATGTLQVTFLSAMPDTSYAVCLSLRNNPGTLSWAELTTKTATGFYIDCMTVTNITTSADVSLTSPLNLNFIVFGD
jgi:hypothetical protein